MSLLPASSSGEVSTGFYNGVIDQALRFEDGDSPRLSKTFGSGGNRKNWTWSAWIKRGNISSNQLLFHTYAQTGFGIEGFIALISDNTISYQFDYNGGSRIRLTTNRVFRDTTNWFHLCCVADSDNSTQGDRIRMYINGVRETSFSSENYPTNTTTDGSFNSAYLHYISGRTNNSDFFDGYLAEVNFLDGVAVTDTSGVLDELIEIKNGVCIPKDYSGSYGTTGFRFTFADSSSLGDDTSGNSNDFSVSGLASTDVVSDSPENNFATLNSIIAVGQRSSATYSEGNLKYTSSDAYDTAISTIGVNSGKYYFESRLNSNGYQLIGLRQDPFTQKTTYIGQNSANSGIAYSRAISSVVNSTAGTTSSVGSASSGDILQVAFDADNGYVWFGINNTYYGTVDSSTGRFTLDGFVSGKDLFPAVGYRDSQTLNFGQDGSFAGGLTGGDIGSATDGNGQGAFKYAPPSGYLALCSANLPDPTIGPQTSTQADDHFNTFLYTGTNATNRNIATNTFTPDWVWIKSRSQTDNHVVVDVLRKNGSNFPNMHPNLTDAEANDSHPKIITNGIQVSQGLYDNNAVNFVVWTWKAGGDPDDVTGNFIKDGVAFTPTQGTIDTTKMSVNTTSGFSIVTYTANNNTKGTVTHGLDSAPNLVIIKNRDTSPNGQWVIGQDQNGFTGQLYFNNGGPFGTNSGAFDDTAPTNAVVTVNTDNTVNEGTDGFVMYSFHNVEGFSRIGSYTGDGNVDGTFVPTGFRVAFLMLVRTSDSGSFQLLDNKRNTFNPTDIYLYVPGSGTEVDGSGLSPAINVDFLSNGFKLRTTENVYNKSSDTFLYMAFAEQPFKFSNAR